MAGPALSGKRANMGSASARGGTTRDNILPAAGCIVKGANPERVAASRAQLFEDTTYAALAETFRVLADPTRVKIVYSLLRQELCTCDLAAITETSESAVSQHLRVLRQLRLVKSRRAGKLVFYSLDDAHIHLLLAVCLSHVQDVEGQQHAAIASLLDLFTMQPAMSATGGA